MNWLAVRRRGGVGLVLDRELAWPSTFVRLGAGFLMKSGDKSPHSKGPGSPTPFNPPDEQARGKLGGVEDKLDQPNAPSATQNVEVMSPPRITSVP